MTSIAVPVLHGDDWEQFCIQALEYRLGASFQKVPAHHHGDYGLDGYVSNETLFQCYGDEAGSSSTQRSKAQRAKLSRDLPKLKKNETEIAALVGEGIKEYVFLVSALSDKAVVEHAVALQETVRGWGLSYLSSSFTISVKDIDFLRVEWELLYGAIKEKLDLPDPSASDPEIDAWVGQQDELVSNLRRKLGDIVGDEGIDEWQRRLIRHHLKEVDVLDKLRPKGPIWQRARELKAQRESTLESPRSVSSPSDDLERLCTDLRSNLQNEIGSLPFPHAHELAWGAAGDWLMRCPLSYS